MTRWLLLVSLVGFAAWFARTADCTISDNELLLAVVLFLATPSVSLGIANAAVVADSRTGRVLVATVTAAISAGVACFVALSVSIARCGVL